MREAILPAFVLAVFSTVMGTGLNAAGGIQTPRIPVWPDKNYPPLVSANRLFSAVRRACPQQGWSEHLLSHTEEGPWDRVAEKLTPAQNETIKKLQDQCDVGLSCPADTRFGLEVQMGYLQELVRAICSQKTP